MSIKKFLLCCLFSLFAVSLYGQETPAEPVEPSPAEPSPDAAAAPAAPAVLEPPRPQLPAGERQRIELEIKTSTLPELAVWARDLGLSEGGTRAELAKRIREHFGMSEPKEVVNENQKTLMIESAQATEYFTIDVINEDYARLKGGVSLSLTDKDSTHKIKADEILFNRTRNIITARGGVEYIRVKGDTTEIFRGQNITVNIDNWSSIFLDGNSEKMLANEGTAYQFEGTVITRNEEDVMILNNASISNAQNEEALWSISASKLWLLPGSDFAILNAILKVGEIPVLYIPFFYYPADEIVFHPVIGYRSREGGFAQTTTYLLGRPQANTADQSSIARILGSSNDMEKERHGLFLRSTGKKALDPNNTILKLLIDYYTNLGIYTGIDLSLPKTGIFNPIDLTLGLGFTRTVSRVGEGYTPYAANDYDGTFDWNNSNLFSESVPFRYRFKTSSSINGKISNISWNFPFYSDPYVDRDFLDRAENMDWFNMIQQGAAFEDETSSQSEVGAYSWQLSGSIRPSFPKLAPYISSISLSSISMTLAFRTLAYNPRNNPEIPPIDSENPGRFFFAPDKYTIYSASGSVTGTPLTIGGSRTTTAAASTGDAEVEDPFKGIGTPRSPWAEEEDAAEKTQNDALLVPPVLSQKFDLPKAGNAKFTIDYSLSPTSSSELQFMSGFNRWETYDQVDWNEVQSVLTSVSGNANVNFRMDHTTGLYSNTVTFSGSSTWRDFSYLNEEAEAYRSPQTSEGEKDENRIKEAQRQQYSQTNYSTSYAYNGTVRPLYDDPVFGQSNVQYSFRGTLVRSKRYDANESPDGPELSPQWGAWVKEERKDGEDILGLSSHKLASNLAANVMNKQQNLSISADLPPFDPLISTNGTFRVWISETNARIDFKKPEKINNLPNDEWKFDPFYLTETLRFHPKSTLTFYMVLNPEEDPDTKLRNQVTTVTSSLTLWDFRASFSAVRARSWEFEMGDIGGSWKQTSDDPTLLPRDLTLSYSKTFPKMDIIKNRMNLSMNVNTRTYFDLQRHTNSNFQFSTGLTLGINRFMDITLSATSDNTVIFRYFKDVPGMEDLTAMYIEGDQNNLFIDLFDSFNFADERKRQRSGFKMKSFNLASVHYMGDWKAEFKISMSPYLNNTTNPPKYEINSDISFLVQWSAITEIKSDITYEGRIEKFTVK